MGGLDTRLRNLDWLEQTGKMLFQVSKEGSVTIQSWAWVSISCYQRDEKWAWVRRFVSILMLGDVDLV